jgi:hypothetical protein
MVEQLLSTLSMGHANNNSEPKGDCVFDVTEESELVAGAGFEPMTFRG